jgi:hypothetical protein
MEDYPRVSRLRWITDSDAETFAKCEPSFGALGNALLDVEELKIFRQGNMQCLPNTAASTSMSDLTYWLVQLSVQTQNPDAALEHLFAYTQKQEMTVHHVLPLADVFPTSPQDPQSFPNGVILRQAGEVPNIRLAMDLTRERVGLPSPTYHYALTKEHRYTVPKPTTKNSENNAAMLPLIDDQKSAQHLEDASLCLSLSTDISEGIFGTFRTFVPDLHTPFATSLVSWELIPFVQPRIGFSLGPSEIAEAAGLAALLDQLPSDDADRIRIPIRHLNLFGARLTLVERALHLRVALETTFLDKDNRTELNDRIGLRTAIVAGTKLEERKVIKREVKDAYNVASTAVHQGTISDKDFDKLTPAAKFCQKALKDFLACGGLPKDWFQIETEGFAPRQHRG